MEGPKVDHVKTGAEQASTLRVGTESAQYQWYLTPSQGRGSQPPAGSTQEGKRDARASEASHVASGMAPGGNPGARRASADEVAEALPRQWRERRDGCESRGLAEAIRWGLGGKEGKPAENEEEREESTEKSTVVEKRSQRRGRHRWRGRNQQSG
eukprot:1563810-Rhodomonas_salina.3